MPKNRTIHDDKIDPIETFITNYRLNDLIKMAIPGSSSINQDSDHFLYALCKGYSLKSAEVEFLYHFLRITQTNPNLSSKDKIYYLIAQNKLKYLKSSKDYRVKCSQPVIMQRLLKKGLIMQKKKYCPYQINPRILKLESIKNILTSIRLILRLP